MPPGSTARSVLLPAALPAGSLRVPFLAGIGPIPAAQEARVRGLKQRTMILSAGTVVAADRDLTPGYVVLEGSRIVRVADGPAPGTGPAAAYPDGVLIPGLIDLQVNGGAGVDCLRCGPEGFDVLGRYLAATGVTAYLPTITSAPLEEMRRAAETAAAAVARPGPLPAVLGVHLEGPYLNPLRRGAHRAQDLRHPSVAEAAETVARTKDAVRIMTLAPELEGAEAVTRWLVAHGVVVSLGHTDAGYDEMAAAARWGARMATHVFNAMRGLHHREPGAAGAALLIPSLAVGVIADLTHIHPAVLRLIARVAGPGRIALVTDAVSAAGMERGTFTLGPQTIEVREGVPRLADGSLAGSALQMARAVYNFAEAADVPFREAVRMASEIPARLLGLPRKGRIAPGCDADLVVLDRDGRVELTIIGGEVLFRRHREA